MHKLNILLLILIISFQYSFWLGKNSIIDYKKTNNYIKIQKIKNNKLKTFNKKIMKEIDFLKKCNSIIYEIS